MHMLRPQHYWHGEDLNSYTDRTPQQSFHVYFSLDMPAKKNLKKFSQKKAPCPLLLSFTYIVPSIQYTLTIISNNSYKIWSIL
jgi:hypothetical protein